MAPQEQSTRPFAKAADSPDAHGMQCSWSSDATICFRPKEAQVCPAAGSLYRYGLLDVGAAVVVVVVLLPSVSVVVVVVVVACSARRGAKLGLSA